MGYLPHQDGVKGVGKWDEDDLQAQKKTGRINHARSSVYYMFWFV
jgi:hypothetical protein